MPVDLDPKVYRSPTLAECQKAFAEGLEGLPEPERAWIRSHASIGVYGKPALILPSVYCEAIDCDRYVGERAAFCRDHWFCVPDKLKRALTSGSNLWSDDPDVGVMMTQSTLYECVLTVADEEEGSAEHVRQIENFRARHRVIQGCLQRLFEARKPKPPAKPGIIVSRDFVADRRCFLAKPMFDTGDLDKAAGVCLSAFPCTLEYLSRARLEDIEPEDVRSKIAVRYTGSLAKGFLRPCHLDEGGSPNGLRGFNAAAWYVSRRVADAALIVDGDCIVVGNLEGFKGVDYGRILSKFLTYAGFDVILYGSPVKLEEDGYRAGFEWKGKPL